jgi:hypothetical protein
LWVENRSDELWIGVKGQSNWEIAGSLRNIFRYGLRWSPQEVEHCMGEGGSHPTDPKQTPNACNASLLLRQRGSKRVGCSLGDRGRAIMCGRERVRTQTVG